MDDPFPPGLNADIEKFFKSERTRASGMDLYSDVFETDLFFPLQRQAELRRMMATAREIKPRIVYEIGADKGGGLYHWCKCFPTVEKVIACEIRGTPYRDLFEYRFPDIEFLWIEGSSYADSTVQTVRKWLDGDLIDCLFIDGDKSHFDTDFYAHLSMMNPHGIVFMHDVNDSGPVDAFRKVCERYKGTEIIRDISDAELAMSREKNGIPSANSHESWLRHWKGTSCTVGVIRLENENA